MADIPIPIPALDDLAGYVESQLATLPDGSTITLPVSPTPYVLARPIRPGRKCFRLQGGGTWRSDCTEPINSVWWSLPKIAENHTGTMIYAPAGFLVADDPIGRRPELADLVIVGNGTGIGIDCGPGGGTSELTVRNVLVANYDVGVRLRFSLDNHFDGLRVRGCNVGVRIDESVTDTVFDRLRVEACGQAVLLRSGMMVHFNGGLIQGNDAGIRIAPAPGDAVSMCSFSRMWWENHAGAVSLAFDVSGGNIDGITFDGCRDGGTYTVPIVTGKNWLAHTTFRGCQWRGTTLQGDKKLTGTVVGQECVFARVKGVAGVRDQVAGTWQ